MSTLVQDVQKQEINSARITLWELEVGSDTESYVADTYVFFHEGLEAIAGSGTKITFRNRQDNSEINSYEALPIQGEGFEWKSEGSSARPTLKVANILNTFSSELGSLTNQDLLGKRLYRRTTLFKYTHSQNNSNPPIEFPVQMYIIDRIAEETPATVTFELSSGYDLEGIKLPRRIVTGTSCGWIYSGAAPEVAEADKVGGCTWSTKGEIEYVDNAAVTETAKVNFINGSDEPVVISTAKIAAYGSSTEILRGGIYEHTAPTMARIQSNGIAVSDSTVKSYWQYMGPTLATSDYHTPPSDSNSLWRRVRIYTAYSASTSYNVYSLALYNSYVLYQDRLWRAVNVSQTGSAHKATPGYNKYWELGDVCSKSIEGCALRYRYIPTTSSSQTVISPDKSEEPLQFGAFPGSRTFS